MKNLIPKCLVAAPTSARHSHLLEEWIKHLDSFTYSYFDVLLVDTTDDDGTYFKLLEKQVVHGKPIKVIRMKWEPENDHILRHLAYAREEIRKEFLKGDYDFLFFCFKGYTKVETINGAKDIKDIQIGDLVKTHNNRFRNVTKIYKRQYNRGRRLLWIKTKNSIIKCTPDHPFYIFDSKFKWIKAKNLNILNSILYPIKTYDNYIKFDCYGRGSKSKNRIANLVYKDGMKNRKFKKDYYGKIKVDEDLARFMGLYLAEGSKNIGNGIDFTFNNNEKEYHKFIIGICNNIFKRNPSIISRWATCIRLNIKSLAPKFCDWFGENAINKKIPNFVWKWNTKNKISFLLGYLQGDGHIVPNGGYSFTTASKRLLDDIIKLCYSLGVDCRFNFIKPTENEMIKSNAHYMGYISKPSWNKLLDILSSNKVVNRGNTNYIQIEIEDILKKKMAFTKDQFVYNLEVEDDNSYIAGPSTVHNCDSDIFLSQNSLQRLMAHYKDNVGICVPIYHKPYQKPCVLKSGNIIISKGADLYDYKEINSYREFIKRFLDKKLTENEKNLVPFIIGDLTRPYLLKCYASGIGCLMIKREVLEKVQFRTHPTFLWGEDFWYFSEANDKHFEFYCDLDPEIEAEHRNVNWNMILEKSKGDMNLTLAFGPSDAKEANLVHEVPEEEYVETKSKLLVIDKGNKK